MTLRQKLKVSSPENAMIVIQDLDPLTITPFELKALLLIQKTRKKDPLAFLGLEAKWWIQDNLKILKKRFVKKEVI